MSKNTILIRPYVTEKMTDLMADKHYAFIVDKDASKVDVQKAIEARYPTVRIRSVRTMICRGKRRRQFTKRGLMEGRTASFKKAIVSLTDESPEIDFFENI